MMHRPSPDPTPLPPPLLFTTAAAATISLSHYLHPTPFSPPPFYWPTLPPPPPATQPSSPSRISDQYIDGDGSALDRFSISFLSFQHCKYELGLHVFRMLFAGYVPNLSFVPELLWQARMIHASNPFD
ncbi:hypothetical protein L1987_24881 [Smallanthus sonchifolius]|uniref:Uncharacterized protein n=1 Tax=Smallanthus sonchifolius TaxID=185202 RepID=A0ACB9IMK8_9ASTR|nr:hypothetical protein L1987_24881 [Smallanthus sonchifolius]